MLLPAAREAQLPIFEGGSMGLYGAGVYGVRWKQPCRGAFMEFGFKLEAGSDSFSAAGSQRSELQDKSRSSFPTTAYAVTKLCTNVERGLV